MQSLPVSFCSLEGYIQAVSQMPMLSAEEEQALTCRLRSQNDLAVAQRLIMFHLRFVVHLARGYVSYGLPLGDLIQEGNVGLMKAVERFDPAYPWNGMIGKRKPAVSWARRWSNSTHTVVLSCNAAGQIRMRPESTAGQTSRLH
ncbi:MAG: hypothetical protein EKK68_11315 [Candidatus Competibacteraceae bacterium]|nr:MAG: hypothetical protein EKK68_11315 [Candidatus Competibacteraceae bacterium]